MSTLGFGIIGTGAIADVHVTSLNEIEGATLIAMASSSEERALEARAKFDVPVYGDYHQLLRHNDIDAVIIATQSGTHLEPTLVAAKSRKHVLCEKPLEVTIARAELMIDACEAANVKLGCIFQNRFNPQYQLVRQAVHGGYLGKLLMANASIHWYRSTSYYADSVWKGTIKGDGGAALINQGIHTIDLLLDLMGDIRSVFGRLGTLVHDIEGEDVANATLQFRNGALGSITAGTALFPGFPERIEVFGEKGSLTLEGGAIKHWNVDGLTQPTVESLGSSLGYDDPMAISNDMHKHQIHDFIEAVKQDRDPLVTGVQALQPLRLILSIYQSAKVGQEIEWV